MTRRELGALLLGPVTVSLCSLREVGLGLVLRGGRSKLTGWWLHLSMPVLILELCVDVRGRSHQ